MTALAGEPALPVANGRYLPDSCTPMGGVTLSNLAEPPANRPRGRDGEGHEGLLVTRRRTARRMLRAPLIAGFLECLPELRTGFVERRPTCERR